jgi:tellurite resistance protein TerC
VKFQEALSWTTLWASAAFTFALFLGPRFIPNWTPAHTSKFLTGYLVELSLSMDNVFVIAMIFSYFRVPKAWQHRVLFWGILGALVMRGVMIWLGSELVEHFHWILYIMGAFLVFTGIKMALAKEDGDGASLERNLVVRIARRFFPMTGQFEGERFIVRRSGRIHLTPLALVLIVVETTDVVFAVDSIPAIFGITTDRFLIFTSNVFAILGLRSLYFVLASAMGFFRYLKFGLALVLVFIGLKMLFEHWLKSWLGESLINLSLACVVGIILLSILGSVLAGWRENTTRDTP